MGDDRNVDDEIRSRMVAALVALQDSDDGPRANARVRTREAMLMARPKLSDLSSLFNELAGQWAAQDDEDPVRHP